MESLSLEKVAGRSRLNLTEQVSWEGFSSFAEKLMPLIGGEVVERFYTIDMHLWRVKVEGCTLELVFEDYPVMAMLDASDDDGDALLERLHEKLAAFERQKG